MWIKQIFYRFLYKKILYKNCIFCFPYFTQFVCPLVHVRLLQVRGYNVQYLIHVQTILR